jgi:hypothetical protein
MRNVSDKSCWEIQNAFYIQNTFYIQKRGFPESRAVCDIMWKKYGRSKQAIDDSVILRMRLDWLDN